MENNKFEYTKYSLKWKDKGKFHIYLQHWLFKC